MSRFGAYDALGRVTQSTGQATLSYVYNPAGQLVNETFPSGRVVAYTYDLAARPITANGTLTGAGNTTMTSYASGISPAGRLQNDFGADGPDARPASGIAACL